MPTMWILLALTVAGMALWWRRRANRRGAPPESIVLLLREHQRFTVHDAARMLSEVLGRAIEAVDLDEPDRPEDASKPAVDAVIGQAPLFFVHLEHMMFVIHSVDRPYLADSAKAAAELPDPRTREALEQHQAFLAMDIFEPKPASVEAYRVSARLLANFDGENCLALYHPPLNTLVARDERTASRLRSDDPVSALFREQNS